MKTYEHLETAPDFAQHTANLWSWSSNYSHPTPATLFLDLIGYSEDELGERLCGNKQPSLGYLELDLLGKALVEYSNRPSDVRDFIERLVESED